MSNTFRLLAAVVLLFLSGCAVFAEEATKVQEIKITHVLEPEVPWENIEAYLRGVEE